MPEIYVTAKITAKPGQANELEKQLMAVIPVVRCEKGCLRYDLHRSQDGPPAFLFYEVWADDADLAAHAASPHMVELRNRIKALVAGPTEVSKWRACDLA
jgi:quinol monooxygenase YgiN